MGLGLWLVGSRGRVRNRVGIMIGIGIRVRVWNRVKAGEMVSVRAWVKKRVRVRKDWG